MKKYLAFFMMILSLNAFAGWKGYVYPEELLYEVDENGSRAYVVFEKKFPIDGCEQDGRFIRINGNTQMGKFNISTILAAITANKQVHPLIYGCDDRGRPVLKGLRISRDK